MDVRDGWSRAVGAAVGHAQVKNASSGCTVVLLPKSCRYSVVAMGGASSFRQVSAMVPGHSITHADAILIVGGSAYGLDAAGGALRYLEAIGRGIKVGAMQVPAVPTAAIFDLFVSNERPDASTGYDACENARIDDVEEGRVGAGAGATIGKIFGLPHAVWGGVGVASMTLRDGLEVAALAVVNAFGNVYDPVTKECVAGVRSDADSFIDMEKFILEGALNNRFPREENVNTTVGVVVTNGRLDHAQCHRAAVLAATAIPMCIRPCFTAFDGDTVFLAATGDVEAEPHQIGIAGRQTLARAIVRAAMLANHGATAWPGN